MGIRFFVGLLTLASICRAVEPTALVLPAGESAPLSVPGVRRVAVADARVVRARVAPPDQVLLTAKRPGRTVVRAWTGGADRVWRVTVVAREIADHWAGALSQSVVTVSLEFLETEAHLARDLGVRWPDAFQAGARATLSGGTETTGLNYTVSFASTQGFLQALLREGWASVVARPELSVRLGEEAHFHSGGEIPVATTSGGYGILHRRIDWKPYGLTVKVGPQSLDGLHVRAAVLLEVTEPAEASTREGVPGINRRKLETKINARLGETLVLSGLVRRGQGRGREGLPGLSSLPLLGWLFGKKSERTAETELLMAITFRLAEASPTASARVESVRQRAEHDPDDR